MGFASIVCQIIYRTLAQTAAVCVHTIIARQLSLKERKIERNRVRGREREQSQYVCVRDRHASELYFWSMWMAIVSCVMYIYIAFGIMCARVFANAKREKEKFGRICVRFVCIERAMCLGLDVWCLEPSESPSKRHFHLLYARICVLFADLVGHFIFGKLLYGSSDENKFARISLDKIRSPNEIWMRVCVCVRDEIQRIQMEYN